MRNRIVRAFLGFVPLALLLAACSGAAPGSAVPSGLGERWQGMHTPTAPLAAIIHDNNIRPPDLGSSVPLLDQLAAELAKSDPNGLYRGVTYDLTTGNALARDWIVQSPGLWGRSDAPKGHSAALTDLVRRLIGSARKSVDLALLQPAPDSEFLAALRDGLADLKRPVVVRIVIGQYPPADIDIAAFTKQLGDIPGVSLHVAALRSCSVLANCDSWSWNHAKIIVIDGREALVGGHNLWSADYLGDDPVHDLSLRLSGPAATSASRFTDALWRFACANDGKPGVRVVGGCPPDLGQERVAMAGSQKVLGIGRLGSGIAKEFANQSELARDLLFGAAKKRVLIVQQDLGFRLGRADTLFPESSFERLAELLVQENGEIWIVLSNPGAVGNTGSTYSNDVPFEAVARRFREVVAKHFEKRTQRGMIDQSPRKGPDPVNALLCSRVHLAPFRFGPVDKWPNGRPIATHAKFYMIDDRAFYVGSDNMYPVNLQEFGYILDDKKAAQDILDGWWTPLWQWSQRAAVSGEGVEKCIFREIPAR
jgi:phosphatidylserine/phosphatidylglycerophosphate/cardiolipin synthase-like enzyme